MLASSYQRVRLWSGITAITLNLSLGWMLFAVAPVLQRLMLGWPFVAQLALCLAGGMLLLLPFELLMGHAVERLVERTEQTVGSWLGDWFRGAARYFLAALFGGLVFGYGSALWWPWRVGLTLLLLAVAFFASEYHFRLAPRAWRPAEAPDPAFENEVRDALAEMKHPPVRLRWIDDSDSFAANGFLIDPTILPGDDETGRRTVGMTTSVVRYFTPHQAALMAVREVFQHRAGFRQTSLAICLGWLFVGLVMVWCAPLVTGSLPPLNSALLGMAIMTTWCFVALFVWPTWNRYWNRRADGFLLTHAPLAAVRDLLVLLQQMNATDLELSGSKAFVFHPIPPLADRLHSLSPNEPNPPPAVLP